MRPSLEAIAEARGLLSAIVSMCALVMIRSAVNAASFTRSGDASWLHSKPDDLGKIDRGVGILIAAQRRCKGKDLHRQQQGGGGGFGPHSVGRNDIVGHFIVSRRSVSNDNDAGPKRLDVSRQR